ncbi:MAG: SAM-dependent DNA methyltransferase [Bacteroidia bacterium]|nr:SAM-dependent DNA methyltransferase [Bacteroidia bacterium]
MTPKKSANERTFQGELLRIISKIISEEKDIHFEKITQEENIGAGKKQRFADGLLYSSAFKSRRVLFELKNTGWDATDEVLVNDAMLKAIEAGIEYYVCGTPRQLVIFKAFEPNTTVYERKKKIYSISNVKKDDDVLFPTYEKTIYSELKKFLKDLSDLINDFREITWDSIDKFFVNKLSSYILEASAEMFEPMYEKISKDNKFKNQLKDYLRSQDIFNVSFNFNAGDIYKICQLSNYLLYLKIMFYSYLQKEVPSLRLKPLQIPEDKKLLNQTLRSRFDDVLQHDFELIFSKNILDEFEFEPHYIPVLKNNVEAIRRLDFNDLNADIVGAIYNILIDNQEQHDRGQHFTNTCEVDIVNAFCINKDTKLILDSGCGAGTFLVRAYYFLKYYHPGLTHEELLEKLWGIEIAPFPVFLSTLNLSLLNIKAFDNYPTIIQSDFSHITPKSTYHGYFLNENKSFEVKNIDGKICDVKIPLFDACVGNPPYIRQELIEHKEKWNELAELEFGIKKINQQSDLYVYYLMHTAAFLRNGGRFGYVISSSWLDVSFGAGFQKFLLEHFKIIAIIDHQKKRSFETALINTVILILEKCDTKKERENNPVRFVRVFNDYENIIGTGSNGERVEKVKAFVETIEKTKKITKTKDYNISIIKQSSLENDSTFEDKYENGHWGAKYLRSPEIFEKLLSVGNGKFVKLSDVVDVQYGIKTGANDFFYITDHTKQALNMPDDEYLLTFGVEKAKHKGIWEKCGWFWSDMSNHHYMIEKFYTKPVLKSQKEAVNLDVDIGNLQFRVIICNESRNKLSKYRTKILQYIDDAESPQYEIHKRPSCSGRADWYDLTASAVTGDFIFPSKIGERFRLIDNRESKVYCDKVNYAINIKDEYTEYADIIFLILNSTVFRYFVDLFSRQMVVKVSDVDVNVVERTLIINPELLKNKKKELSKIFQSLKSREQGTIFEEIKQADKRKLDEIIFEILGMKSSEVDELYREACKYVQDRKEKSESLNTSKTKQKLSYDDALKLIQDRFGEIHKYKDLVKNLNCTQYNIPEWKAKYPKEGVGAENLFGIYNVYFTEGTRQKSLSFENVQQLKLFEFLNFTLDVKGVKIDIPRDAADCDRIYKILKKDFDKNSSQIKSLLKLNRSKANHISIYRDLALSVSNF